MIDERERKRRERWGSIKPEPIFPPDEPRPHPDDLPPRLPTAMTSRLDAIRVWTIHEPYRPLCPRCHRPFNPDSPLMAPIRQAGLKGCYSCAPLTYVFD